MTNLMHSNYAAVIAAISYAFRGFPANQRHYGEQPVTLLPFPNVIQIGPM